MQLLDTNILIYAGRKQHLFLRSYFNNQNYVSDVSRIESLGYPKITHQEEQFLKSAFQKLNVISITEDVIQKTIEIKQSSKCKLGDSLIAATAIVYNLTLITANVKDFVGIPDLKVESPTI